MGCLTPFLPQTARIYDTDGAYHSLFANSDKSGLARDAVLVIRKRKDFRRVAGSCRGGEGEDCELARTLTASATTSIDTHGIQ